MMNYEQAKNMSRMLPWKVDECSEGKSCWCRIVIPENFIPYKEGDAEGQIEFIIPSSSINREDAEHIVHIHNLSLKIKS